MPILEIDKIDGYIGFSTTQSVQDYPFFSFKFNKFYIIF